MNDLMCFKIAQLVEYGVSQGLCASSDALYVRHRLMALLRVDAWIAPVVGVTPPEFGGVQEVLDALLALALERGVLPNDGVTAKDLFDTALMDCLLPPPSVLQNEFLQRFRESPQTATNYYYQQSRASNYVRMARVAKNLSWTYASDFGMLDITINLSKPEKDPKAIIAEGQVSIGKKYPACLLCVENEGYAGRVDHPARQNLRLMPVVLQNEDWRLQYSPYEYYNEHCIVLKAVHEPMAISTKTFARLLDFVAQFPHYFVGSNADLPIVGGSILSHDHFQGGRYDFAMASARVVHERVSSLHNDVTVQILHWPLSVVRLIGANVPHLLDVADLVLNEWRGFSDATIDVVAFTGEGEHRTPHNTITPIARQRDGVFELDLVLRNNRTSTMHPLGIFHPHSELHHIKKENIGLIEVLGLAILPDRLVGMLDGLAACLDEQAQLSDYPELESHAAWFESISPLFIQGDDPMLFLRNQVGVVFEQVLTHAGVFKTTEMGVNAFKTFLERF